MYNQTISEVFNINTDKIKRNAINTLAKTIVAAMPGSYFAAAGHANDYMLCGDEKFSQNPGSHFTCGFAKAVLTPADIDTKKYYIAGYDSNNPAVGVADDMFARAFYVDDNTGRGGAIICAVDAVGLSRKDINDIRRLVITSKKIPALKSINICSTHTHSAVDTQGLWGEKLYKSGRDELFMIRLKHRTAKAIISAYENRRDGEMFYSVSPTKDLQFDCRTPETYDSNLTRLRFAPFDSTGEIFIVNFASHAELLGNKTRHISADFPAHMIKRIEEQNIGSDAMFINGAIGGMISAKEIKKVYRNEIDCPKYTREFGEMLGDIANAATSETKLEPLVNVKSSAVKIEAENFVLILARLLKVLNNDIARSAKKTAACICTEVGYMELGNAEIGMFLIPGELFPELFTGEFLDENSSATGKVAQYKPLKQAGNAKHKFVVGLCNDELGYIIPENDFLLNSATPYIDSAHDKFDRNHYEETNSTGPKTAAALLNATEELINSAYRR